jgi:hypothetical protein
MLSVPVLRKRGIHFRDLRSYLFEYNIPFSMLRYQMREHNAHIPQAARILK